ncbi:MAG: FAD-dependent oxidoreductase [Bacillota bacterium]|nr:FAD-dependent oxidoreductase [Bacillota bacterium]
MRTTEICVIGAGPAGLCAAIAARDMGARVTCVDSGDRPGGQLVKQTHKFFGSRAEFAGKRGIDIAGMLADRIRDDPMVEFMLDSTVIGFYDDGAIGIEHNDALTFLRGERIVCATGASERMLAFPGNDLPGVYGAGAVQTLMNVYGVRPGKAVLMVGAGNIGLIVSYQLLQAGVEVVAVVEAMPQVGGYDVHARKIQRVGVPILTSHTVKAVHGTRVVEGATVVALGSDFRPIPATEEYFHVDTVCLAVGLTPLADLLWQAGCKMAYVPELGGHVALRGEDYETSRRGIYVAGDLAGIEEASSAMIEGTIAGLSAAQSLGHEAPDFEERLATARAELAALRSGPKGQKVRLGIERLMRLGREVGVVA